MTGIQEVSADSYGEHLLSLEGLSAKCLWDTQTLPESPGTVDGVGSHHMDSEMGTEAGGDLGTGRGEAVAQATGPQGHRG